MNEIEELTLERAQQHQEGCPMNEPSYDPRASVTLEEADRPDSEEGGYLLTMPAARFLLTGAQLGIILGFAKSMLPEVFVDARLSLENAALRERAEALSVLVKQLEARDGRPMHLVWNGTEWVDDRCGCRFHPDPFPHVHPCSDEHKRPDLHGIVRDG